MAQQEEGWPLGLQPLNVRIGLARNPEFSGSISFNTLLTGSPSSFSDSSSDLDTESTGSFFHDKSITLGSLIGVSSIIERSRRSVRARGQEVLKDKKSNKSKTWFFSLCPTDTTDAESVNNPTPSLGQFLAVERRAANTDSTGRNQSPSYFGPEELAFAPQPSAEANSLFVDGRVAPPQSNPLLGAEVERRDEKSGLEHGIPVLFSCVCGQPSH
ncbi:uncharacterized protein At3g17950-like isoform X2 [Malania oleifera]|uniref:uncharacterized protein At3g17950-like isoform X2 n=1 Tax=Malania oleifera TaxID=397392 RepID=UPI0025AEAD6F|nr:uncharacterized protein At3g17950-like isoform X2 [Malania oleifera]